MECPTVLRMPLTLLPRKTSAMIAITANSARMSERLPTSTTDGPGSEHRQAIVGYPGRRTGAICPLAANSVISLMPLSSLRVG